VTSAGGKITKSRAHQITKFAVRVRGGSSAG
jgi:hypothetical protein